MLYGVDRLGASTASFVSMLESVISVVFATVWFRDPVTVGITAGGILVIIMLSVLLSVFALRQVEVHTISRE